MTQFSLVESSPQIPDGITCRHFVVDKSQAAQHTILVSSYFGSCPDGSQGSAHGAYIAASALHGIQAFKADCLVLDLRELAFRWGGMLHKVIQDVALFMDADAEPDQPRFPIIAVTSDKSRAAFLSQVMRSGQKSPDWHFDNVDDAIAYALNKVEECLAY